MIDKMSDEQLNNLKKTSYQFLDVEIKKLINNVSKILHKDEIYKNKYILLLRNMGIFEHSKNMNMLFLDLIKIIKNYCNNIEDFKQIVKDKQDEEYKKTMIMDMERMRLKDEQDEIKNVIEISKKMYIEEKRNRIKEEPEESKENYIFQFKLPNNNRIKRIFHNTSSLLDVRNFLDVYFYDNKITIENYDLIIFPKKVFNIDNLNKINEYNFEKNTLFFIHDLDS